MSQTIFMYSASVYLFFHFILRPSFSRLCKRQHSFLFCCWWLNLQSYFLTSQDSPWMIIQLPPIDHWYEHIPWSNHEKFRTFSVQRFCKIVSNHEMISTILNLYFYPVNSILHKEMAYIYMHGISCKGILPILCHTYGPLIILKNNILNNLTSLCLQKHNHSCIESNILTSFYKFSLSRSFFIHICLTR